MGNSADAVRIGVLVLPNEPWPDLVARWQRLEAAGVDSIWSCDHFTNPHRPGEPWFEGWAGLTGLAAATERVRVGLLVGAIVSRSPSTSTWSTGSPGRTRSPPKAAGTGPREP